MSKYENKNTEVINNLNYNSISKLLSYWGDYHKDFYGYRPRCVTLDQANSEQWILEQIAIIDSQIEFLKQTTEGRATLRSNGWCIEDYQFDNKGKF